MATTQRDAVDEDASYKKLGEFLSEVDRLAKEVAYFEPSDLYLKIKQRIREEGIHGNISFKEPIALNSHAVNYGYKIVFLSGKVTLYGIGFLDPKVHALASLVCLELGMGKACVPHSSYTEAVALLLAPEVRSAIDGGKAVFSDRKFEDFVQLVLDTADAAMERKVYRVIMKDIFNPSRSKLFEWRYIFEVDGLVPIDVIGITKHCDIYEVKMYRRGGDALGDIAGLKNTGPVTSFTVKDLEARKKVQLEYGRAGRVVTIETSRILEAIFSIAEDFKKRGKKNVLNYRDRLVLARVALTAYVI